MTDHIKITDTPLAGLKLLQRQPIGDARGYLERLFCDDELRAVLADRSIKQINRTLTHKAGTVRGMHYQQPPHAECKVVSCLHGEVFDVAVDLRKDSPTFRHWHGQILGGDNHLSFLIPEGFAHGFQALTEDCEMLYFHTAAYNEDAEAGLNACDPVLNIQWPNDMTERSMRDQNHRMIAANFQGISP